MDPARPDEPPGAAARTPLAARRRAPVHRASSRRASTCGSSASRWSSSWRSSSSGPVLTPFLVGAILAYIGTPLVDRLQRRGHLAHARHARRHAAVRRRRVRAAARAGPAGAGGVRARREEAARPLRAPGRAARAVARARTSASSIALDLATIRELVTENLDEREGPIRRASSRASRPAGCSCSRCSSTSR